MFERGHLTSVLQEESLGDQECVPQSPPPHLVRENRTSQMASDRN